MCPKRSQINIEDGWVPSRLIRTKDELILEFVEFKGRQLESPFLRQDTSRCSRSVLVDVDNLLDSRYEQSIEVVQKRIGGYLLHMSRCGSTLVANMLRQQPEVQVVAEPDILGQLLMTYRGDEQKLIRLLRLFVNLLILSLCSKDQKLIIKWSSWNCYAAETIVRAFPETPICYLFRSPVEVLVSLQKSIPEWFGQKSIESAISEQTRYFTGDINSNRFYSLLKQCLDDDKEASIARMVAQCCKSIAKIDKEILIISYESLPEVVVTDIAPHFSMKTTKIFSELALAQSRWNTKSLESRSVFRPDSDAKVRKAKSNTRHLAEQIIFPALKLIVERNDFICASPANPRYVTSGDSDSSSKSSQIGIDAEKNSRLEIKPIVKWI